MATRMLQRRGTAAEWAAENPVLASGEIGFETDTKLMKMGDGVTPWLSLAMPYVMTGGATMTGPLSVINPTDPAHATPKSYVDQQVGERTAEVRSYNYLASANDLFTTPGRVSANIPIPSSWGSYDLECSITVKVANAGGTTRNTWVAIQKDLVEQESWNQKLAPASASNLDQASFGPTWHAQGMTEAIGGTLNLRWEMGANGADINASRIYVQHRAFRTS